MDRIINHDTIEIGGNSKYEYRKHNQQVALKSILLVNEKEFIEKVNVYRIKTRSRTFKIFKKITDEILKLILIFRFLIIQYYILIYMF